MSNHLGNVLTVINDVKVPYLEQDNLLFRATIVSTADFSPFGVQLDERTESLESYRFGYQGSEKDDEVKGEGNSYTTEFRLLDPRLGRWLSIDPLADEFPWQSPYCSMDNNPVNLNDISGLSAGEGEPEKSKSACSSGDCQAYRTPNRIDGAVNEQGNVFLPSSAEVTQVNDNNQVTRFWYDNDVYAWDSKKGWYYGVVSGNEYYEGSYSDGLSNNFTPSNAGVSRAAESWRSFIYSPFDAIGDSWNNWEGWKKGYFTAYYGMSSYQRGASDGGFFTSFVEGLPIMAISAGMTGAPRLLTTQFGITRGGIMTGIQGGSTFSQYKRMRGGTETLGNIYTTNAQGVPVLQRISVEYHHVFITQRVQRYYGLPNWTVNNRINVWKMNTIQHSIMDAYRFNFLRTGMKSQVGIFKKYHWFYNKFEN